MILGIMFSDFSINITIFKLQKLYPFFKKKCKRAYKTEKNKFTHERNYSQKYFLNKKCWSR